MKITEIRHYLSERNNKELIELIVSLYKLDNKNKDFIKSLIIPENDEVLFEKYKKIIENEFFPERGEPKVRFSVMRSALNDFKRICRNSVLIAKLMLDYAFFGVEFANTYGHINEDFYFKIENLYRDALNYIFKNNLQNKFDDFCLKIKCRAEEIDLEFGHDMEDIYYAFYIPNIDI